MTKPVDFPTSHVKGPQHWAWRGGRQPSGNGAVQIVAHGHPRADAKGRVYEHILIAEKALGKPLPLGAIVHHRDEDRTHNEPGNLVICQDQAYHLLLHRRLRAYRACGHAGWFKCRHCGKWDAPSNLYVRERQHDGPLAHHRTCHAAAARKS